MGRLSRNETLESSSARGVRSSNRSFQPVWNVAASPARVVVDRSTRKVLGGRWGNCLRADAPSRCDGASPRASSGFGGKARGRMRSGRALWLSPFEAVAVSSPCRRRRAKGAVGRSRGEVHKWARTLRSIGAGVARPIASSENAGEDSRYALGVLDRGRRTATRSDQDSRTHCRRFSCRATKWRLRPALASASRGRFRARGRASGRRPKPLARYRRSMRYPIAGFAGREVEVPSRRRRRWWWSAQGKGRRTATSGVFCVAP